MYIPSEFSGLRSSYRARGILLATGIWLFGKGGFSPRLALAGNLDLRAADRHGLGPLCGPAVMVSIFLLPT